MDSELKREIYLFILTKSERKHVLAFLLECKKNSKKLFFQRKQHSFTLLDEKKRGHSGGKLLNSPRAERSSTNLVISCLN